jgi:hypothetical protein
MDRKGCDPRERPALIELAGPAPLLEPITSEG